MSLEQGISALTVIGANLQGVQVQSAMQMQGGSLFALAATKYGDPSSAYALMTANGIASPIPHGAFVTNVALLPLPPTSS
jgi:hypothetical protein